MVDFQNLVASRRSIRKFTDEPLTSEQVGVILKAALMSPSSKGKESWQFLLVEDKEMLRKLSLCKKSGSKPIEGCALAVIVLADPLTSDVWIEDASVASVMMQLQAEDLGLGSCWIQVRERYTEEDVSSGDYIRGLFDIPIQLQVLSVVALGNKAQVRPPVDEDKLRWEKVHIGKFNIDQLAE